MSSLSTTVRLALRVAADEIDVAQVGGGRLYFDHDLVVPSGPAELVIEIDGDAHAEPVELRGSSTPSRIACYEPCPI